MRKKLYFIGAILFCILFFDTSFVFAEEILDFHSDITIQKDSVLLIKETIIYYFGNLQKHGIYRDIPLENISINVQKVSDENGTPYKYSVSHQGKNLEIKIGDANFTISGVHTYNIFYSVSGGLRFFDDHDELYWNMTGDDWQVPIEKSSAKITLPQKLAESSLQFTCFTGSYGSKASECNWQTDAQGNIIFESARSFSAGEGLTIVLGWPKEIIKEPVFNPFSIWLQKFWPIFIPILVFIFLFRKWSKEGKDFPSKGPVIAQYEPPENLRPLEVGLIMNQKINPDDAPALIIDLAVRGYIKIREVEKKGLFGKKDYMFIQTKDFNDQNADLQPYEKNFLKNIFANWLGNWDKGKGGILVLVSSLKNSFYTNINELINKVSDAVTLSGYFVLNPKDERKKWAGIGGTIITVGLLFPYFIFHIFWPTNPAFPIIIFPSVIVSGILFIVFSVFMPKRTTKGAEAYWGILGFKEYINTAEKYRIQFQEKENIFEKFLPYAMIFGLAEKWGKAFEGIYNAPPSWYEGDFGTTFNAAIFATAINNNFNAIGATINSRPGGGSGGSGLGGGGFSGGGGGGGGGGSW